LEDETGSLLEEDQIQVGGSGNGGSSEDGLDDWAEFDEERDEMVAELETMLGPDYDGDMWDNCLYDIFWCGNICQCCINH